MHQEETAIAMFKLHCELIVKSKANVFDKDVVEIANELRDELYQRADDIQMESIIIMGGNNSALADELKELADICVAEFIQSRN